MVTIFTPAASAPNSVVVVVVAGVALAGQSASDSMSWRNNFLASRNAL